MSTSDPIADMLTRVRNGLMAKHEVVDAAHSKFKVEIARILKREGYILDYVSEGQGPNGKLRIYLKYTGDNEPAIRGLRRLSKPGLRRYVKSDKVPKALWGLGTVVLSTPLGLLTDKESRKKKVGGEMLFEVW